MRSQRSLFVLSLHRLDESILSRGQAFFAFDYRDLARVRKDVGGSTVAPRSFVSTATSERRREGEQGTGREEAPAKRSKDSDETFVPRLPFEVIDYIEWGLRARQALL